MITSPANLEPFSDSPAASQPYLPVGRCSTIFIGSSGILAAITALGWMPADWLQPTVVGVLLSTLFLLGLAAGEVRQGSLSFACLAFMHALLCKSALQSITAMSHAESLLVLVCCFGFGWMTVWLDPLSVPAGRGTRYQLRQWTLWDLAWLTIWVACICHSYPRIESPLYLLIEVGFVLAGVAVAGWMSVRWVQDDRWNLLKLAALISTLLLGLSLMIVLRPSPMSLLQVAAWMLTGPVAVVASHGVTVLVALTAVRIDRGSLARANANTDDGIVTPMQSHALRIHSGG